MEVSPTVLTRRWFPTGFSGGGATFTPAISPHNPQVMLLNCDMSCAFRTEDGGQSWKMFHWSHMLGNPYCAGVFHPTDPQIVFAGYGYASTLRISRDGGKTFAPYGKGLPGNLHHLKIDTAGHNRMLAATPTQLYRSLDAGLNWQQIAQSSTAMTSIHIDQSSGLANRRLFLMTRETVFRSTDDGISWQQCGAGLPMKPILASTAASNKGVGVRLYLWVDEAASNGASTGAIYRSDDAGNTWLRMADRPVPSSEANEDRYLLVTDTKPDTVYAVHRRRSDEPFVHRSDDGGRTWRPVMFGNKYDKSFNLSANHLSNYFNSQAGWGITAVGICPTNPDIVLVSDYCTPYLTDNGGKTWRNLDTHLAPSHNQPDKSDRWVNNGLTVTTTWNYYVDPFEAQRHYICYTDIGFARTTDKGASWAWQREMAPNTYELAFDPEVPGRIWGAFSQVHDIPNNNIVIGEHGSTGYGIVGYSTDFGATWTDPTLKVPLDDERWFGRHRRDNGTLCGGLPQTPIVSVIVDPKSPRDKRRLYASAWEHGVYQSDDSGQTWASISNGLGAPGVNMRVCRVRLHSDGTLFCLVTGKRREQWLMPEGVGLYASANGGRSWKNITTGQDFRWLTDFDIDPHDSSVIYLAVCEDPGRQKNESGLYKTMNGGGHWSRVAQFAKLHFGATIHPYRPGWVYLTLTYNEGKTSPLWLSKDAGKHWTPFEDYPFCSAHRVHFDPSNPETIYVTGYGGSVWQGPVEP